MYSDLKRHIKMNNVLSITPAKYLQGEISLPGDKSISHRSIILASIAGFDIVAFGTFVIEKIIWRLKNEN